VAKTDLNPQAGGARGADAEQGPLELGVRKGRRVLKGLEPDD
jgi:hypothetical protein